MFKKKVLGVITLLSTALFLGACGNGSESGGGTSSDENLSVAIWDSFQEPGLREIMDDFTDETGVGVDLQVITWDEYWTLLQAGAQGGTMPDVFWMHSNEFQRYADNGMLLDLTDKIASSDVIDLDNFFDDIVDLYNFDGNQYAIPKDVDSIALWYNRTMFEEAGVATPDETWTWETFLEAAEALTKEDGSQFGTAWNVTNEQDGYFNLIYSMGGYVINEDRTASGFDNPQTIEAFEFVERLLPSMPSLEVMSENGVDVLFSSGQIAMATIGSWMISGFAENDYLLENADIAVLPMSEDGTRASIYNGLGWAASAEGNNTENAWKLIEFLGSEEMQIKQADLGVTMSAFEGTSDNWVKSVPEFNLQAYLDMMDYAVMRPYSRNTLAWFNMFTTRLQDVWLGQRPAAEVLPEIAEEMNQMLAEE